MSPAGGGHTRASSIRRSSTRWMWRAEPRAGIGSFARPGAAFWSPRTTEWSVASVRSALPRRRTGARCTRSTWTPSVGARGWAVTFSPPGRGLLLDDGHWQACSGFSTGMPGPEPSTNAKDGLPGKPIRIENIGGADVNEARYEKVSRAGLTRSKSPGTVTFRLPGSPATPRYRSQRSLRAIAAVSWASYPAMAAAA